MKEFILNQYHSIDILSIQIISVIFWCNPLIWFYKKEIEQNLEFIADDEAQKQSYCEKSYQHLLLKASVPNYQMALTNNFYNSLIKKRIIMLHKSKSKQLNVWKYALILPILALFLMSFSTKEIYVEKEIPVSIQPIDASTNINYLNNITNTTKSDKNEFIVKTTSKNVEEIVTDIEVVVISKDFTDTDFDKLVKELKEKGLTIKFKGIKRNNKGEITAIKIDAKAKKSSVNYNTNSDEAIQPIKISFHTDGSNISIGNGKSSHGKSFYHFNTNANHQKVHKKGKGNRVFVYNIDEEHEHEEDEEHDEEHEVEYEVHQEHENGEEHETVIIRKGKGKHKVRTKVVEINSDHEGDGIYFIEKDGDGKTIKEDIIIKEGDTNVWHDDDNETHEVRIIKKGKGEMLFISDDGKNPLIIYNGKEISKEEMEKLNPKTFKKVNVLKGDKAIEEHGKKAKDGVIIITSKD